MDNITKLVINIKTEIDSSLSILLTSFSHKNATSNKQASVESSHLILFKDGKEHELILSTYESEDKVTFKKEYSSINWQGYTINLKHIKYDEFIDIQITKNIRSGKNELIQQANKVISSKYPQFVFDPLLYEITAWKNSEKTIIKYKRRIKFIPLNKKDESLRFDFEVNLKNRVILPFDFHEFNGFYIPTIEEQEKINFVIKSFGLSRFGFNNTITEDTDMYRILIDSKAAFGRYFIDKTTGKECLGPIEGSYNQTPNNTKLNNTNPLIEIK